MMQLILKAAIMMVVIVVDLMSLHLLAHNVCALKEEERVVVVEELQQLPELQLPELAIRVGLLMGIVMISTII